MDSKRRPHSGSCSIAFNRVQCELHRPGFRRPLRFTRETASHSSRRRHRDRLYRARPYRSTQTPRSPGHRRLRFHPQCPRHRDKWGIPDVYGDHDYRSLVNSTNVDVVHITSPNKVHVVQSLAALAAGKHVICEKPLGMTTAETKQVVAAVKKNPRRSSR